MEMLSNRIVQSTRLVESDPRKRPNDGAVRLLNWLNHMDISVIIVNWNTKEMLLDCLKSLTKQNISYTNEIIVVDNGSTDGSQEAVRAAFPDVQIIENNANLGFAKANNIGILKSRGRYVCLINSDVIVMDNCLQHLMTFMDSNTKIGIAGPKILNPNLTLQNSCRSLPTLWNNLSPALGLDKIFKNMPFFSGVNMRFFDHRSVRKVEALAGCCLIIRKTALDQVGLFDEQYFIYFEETDLCKRFGQAGWDIVFCPDASIIHHHGASSAKDPARFNIEQMKSQMKYWKKYNSRITLIIFQFILLLQHGARLILRSILYPFKAQAKKMEIARQLSKHYACVKLILSGQYDSSN